MSKVSARNKMRGKVIKIEKDGLMAKVRVRVEEPFVFTVVVASEAVDELNIKKGDEAEAIITATEVMLQKLKE